MAPDACVMQECLRSIDPSSEHTDLLPVYWLKRKTLEEAQKQKRNALGIYIRFSSEREYNSGLCNASQQRARSAEADP